MIEVDGGHRAGDPAGGRAAAGATMFVSASSIFGAPDPDRGLPRARRAGGGVSAAAPPASARELRGARRARCELALNGRGRVSPNPLVGAVVLRDGEIVAEGWHEGPGLPHAEAMALAAAGEAARGSTVVCTLEPCSHHGRTPPCADALVAAGVARVVIGLLDPLERDRAQGREVLRAAGIEVAVADGDEAAACAELNAPFLTCGRHGPARGHAEARDQPGRQDRDGHGGEPLDLGAGRRAALVHRWRADSDAVAVGLGTALADDPRLTARDLEGPVRQPARVVFDSAGAAAARARPWSATSASAPVIVLAAEERRRRRVAAP